MSHPLSYPCKKRDMLDMEPTFVPLAASFSSSRLFVPCIYLPSLVLPCPLVLVLFPSSTFCPLLLCQAYS